MNPDDPRQLHVDIWLTPAIRPGVSAASLIANAEPGALNERHQEGCELGPEWPESRCLALEQHFVALFDKAKEHLDYWANHRGADNPHPVTSNAWTSTHGPYDPTIDDDEDIDVLCLGVRVLVDHEETRDGPTAVALRAAVMDALDRAAK